MLRSGLVSFYPPDNEKTAQEVIFSPSSVHNLEDHQSSRNTAQTQPTFPAFRFVWLLPSKLHQQRDTSFEGPSAMNMSRKTKRRTPSFSVKKEAFVPGGLQHENVKCEPREPQARKYLQSPAPK